MGIGPALKIQNNRAPAWFIPAESPYPQNFAWAACVK